MRLPLLFGLLLVACQPGSVPPVPPEEPSPICPPGKPVLVNLVRNARDLGGITSASGTTSCGYVFRSAAPGSLDDVGCAKLKALGITTLIDLREASEWGALPDPTCVNVVHAPLPIPYSLSIANYLDDLRSDASMKLVFETLASAPGGVLFHCTFGRDRSGVVAAVLLRAAGVSRAEVMNDYLRTAENGLGGTPPSLEAVLDDLDATGGARSRLERIGLSAEQWNVIAARLVKAP